ncbi:MAG: hypothetical protein V7632_1973 [Bradyrhizobium sp.]|jgi:hypothetical protein
MDEQGPPIPLSDILLRCASERTSANIEAPPDPHRNDPPAESPVAVYNQDEADVRDGFLIALRAMGLAGIAQHSEPTTPPVTGAKS